MSSFTPIVVLDGQEKIADAVEGIAAINVSHLAVGDGNGSAISPLETMTDMVNEVWRGSVTAAQRDPNDPTKVIFQATIPLEAGPFTIREVAAFTSDGKLFAIGSYPEQFKPTAAQGAVSSIAIDFVVVIAETAQVTVAVNPSDLIFLNNFARIPFYAVDGIENDPAADPAPGDMVIVGDSPNAAFADNAGKLAQWNGSVWLTASPPVGTVAGTPDGEYYRWTGSAWVPWRAQQSAPGLIALSDLEMLPFYPEIESTDGKISVTDNGDGTITIDPDQVIRWRGFRRFNTSDFSAGDRTFAHSADKTYHLRFYPPGHGDASNAANWPNGRFALKDLASSGYNPGSEDEADGVFNTGYDDVLLARIVTNGSNIPEIKSLRNSHQMVKTVLHDDDDLVDSGANGSRTFFEVVFDWARTPEVILTPVRAGQNGPHPVDGRVDIDLLITTSEISRYLVSGMYRFDNCTRIALTIHARV